MTEPTPNDFDFAYPTTDLGNAQRLRHRWGDDLLYVPERDKWLTWSGNHWEWDDTGQVSRWAAETMLYAQAAEPGLVADPDDAKDLGSWAERSQSETKLRKMVQLASEGPGMARTLEDLDAQPWKLTAANGTVDLRTGQLTEPERDDLITVGLDTEYHPDAKAPRFAEFLEQVQPDTEVCHFLQKAMGYTATGSIREQVLFLPHGDGSNGKSTFVEAVSHVLGDLAKTTPDTTFTGTRNQHPEALARLRGARLVSVTESGTNTSLREGTVKAVTGGEPVAARFLYGDTFEYEPNFTIWFPVNWLPTVNGEDRGIWRRLIPVPFKVTIGRAERDPDLPAKLREEAEGVLAWVVEGAQRWFVERLDDIPDAIEQSRAEYQSMMNHVGRFLEDVFDRDPDGFVKNSTLYEVARLWFRAQGIDPPSAVELGRKLSKHGIDTGKRSGDRARLGVVVNSEWQGKLREAQIGV